MKRILLLIIAFVLLTSCKSWRTITIEKPVYVHDTTQTIKEIHDSTYIDRWHTVEVKGDTIFLTNNQITVKYRTVTDTVYKYVEKPVEVEVEKIKEVEKPLSWLQKTLMGLGFAGLIGVIGFALWRIKK